MKSDKQLRRQRIKAEKKLGKAARKGKLRRHVKEQANEIKNTRMVSNQALFSQIHRDWLLDRRVHRREREELSDDTCSDASVDDLIDMLDPELFIDAKNDGKKTQNHDDEDIQMDSNEWNEQIRTFLTEEELLPVKIGGKIVKRIRPVTDESEEEQLVPVDDVEVELNKEMELKPEWDVNKGLALSEQQPMDLNAMNVEELAAHRSALLAKTELTVTMAADQIILNPQENVSKFCGLIKMAAGEDSPSPLVREDIQKLVTASLAELFVNVLPGYKVHMFTEMEKTQKMKKETKKLVVFEQALLNYYVKYLKFLEKNATKLIKNRLDKSTFSTQFGFLCAKCMCRLAEACVHFNYAANIISCLVRLSICKWDELLNTICASLSRIFADDTQLEISLHAVKAISTFVEKKKAYVPTQLISTLLSLNIKEINRDPPVDKMAKNRNVRERKLRKMRKYQKQIGRIENELKEAVAVDSFSTKQQLAAEVIKHLFITYFRILRRMPLTSLLCPILSGLSKFVHLINVEFYDDLVLHLGHLVELKQLKLSDTLKCIWTASFILTGQGQAIDVDLEKFYKALFATMPNICFQSDQEFEADITTFANSIQLLFIQRRKTVSPARAAAFIKRLSLICIPLKTSYIIVFLLLLRKIILTHSALKALLELDETEDYLVVNGQFRPDCADPDHSNSLCTSLIDELKLFATHPNQFVRGLALHFLNGFPVSGKYRLEARWTNMEPIEVRKLLIDESMVGDDTAYFLGQVQSFCKRHKRVYCSESLCSTLCLFLDEVKKKNIQKKAVL